MRLHELNNLQPFKTDEYNTPNQMEIMANPDYWREKKGVVGGVQWMTPTQYIQACEAGFKKSGSEGLVRDGRNPELIRKYAFDMKRGDKFPMLELDYRNDYFGQEGLHRAMAAETIDVKKLPVFIMKDSPEKEKSKLSEGLSPVLYHYISHPVKAYNILSQDQFKLSAAPGTESEKALQRGDRFYYLSTARHKLGGYHLGAYKMGVLLTLDGDALSHNYAGKAVDFYGADWYGPGKKGYQEKEAEDRIYSYKPIIPKATKYIKEVHVFYVKEYQETEPRYAIDIRRLAIEAKKNNIPFYFYEDKKAWLNQNTRKAINPATVDVIQKASGRANDKRKNYPSSRKYLAPWVELYMAPVGSQISKEAEKVRYDYVLYGYSDAHQSLAADMHNAKQRAADSPGYVELLKIFRKEKIRNTQEYIDLLKDKWKPKDES